MKSVLLYLKIDRYNPGILFISALFSLILFQCAPYSLPEKKSYAEAEDPYTYYVQSIEAYDSGDFSLALTRINQAILLNKDMAKFYLQKGEIYRAQDSFAEALASYEQALKKRSNFVEAQEAIAAIYLEQKNYDQAIRAYKKVAGLAPERIDVLLSLADCYLLWNEVDVAQHHLDNYEKTAAEQRKPISDKYYEIRADALYQQKKYQASISTLNKIQKPDRRALYLFGLDYYALADYESGVGFFNKLLNLDKENGLWFYYRGIYFYKKNDHRDAKSQFQLAIDLDQSLTEVSYYLGMIYLQEDNRAAAMEQFELYRKSGVDPALLQEVDIILSPQKPE